MTADTFKKLKETAPAIVVGAQATHDESEELIISTEKKLVALHNLQQIDSQVDRIKIIRGELPLEVEDLEDEVIGLETRISNFEAEVKNLEKSVVEKENSIKESKLMIKKYQEQQMNVRNNREYDSLTKEIEFQELEIQLADKRIREYKLSITSTSEEIQQAQSVLADRKADLDVKRHELADIVAETEKEEQQLMLRSKTNQQYIEDRLLSAYHRIRKNARNGLAVVVVERDACGGCFSKIPPQRQLDIKMHRKIIVCEYCGRIIIDPAIVEKALQQP